MYFQNTFRGINPLNFKSVFLQYLPLIKQQCTMLETLHVYSPNWHVLWRKLANICTTVLYPFWQCAVEHNCLTHTKHAKMTPELATDMSCGRSMVLYSCVSFCLLAQESRDISQAETKITLVNSWTNFKKWQLFSLKKMIFFFITSDS